MSVATKHPPITADELEDVRWLAREAVVTASCGGIGGETPADDLWDVVLVMRRAWALGATDTEFNGDVPGTQYDRGDAARWPRHLSAEHVAVLLEAAEELADMYADGLKESTSSSGSDEERPLYEAYYGSRLERVRRAHATLQRGRA